MQICSSLYKDITMVLSINIPVQLMDDNFVSVIPLKDHIHIFNLLHVVLSVRVGGDGSHGDGRSKHWWRGSSSSLTIAHLALPSVFYGGDIVWKSQNL